MRGLGHPYLLLTLCVTFWAGNFVVGRAAADVVPPLGLSFWRWCLAGLLILPFAWSPLRRNWPLLRNSLGRMTVLALLGVSIFNTLVYLGLQSTQATNAVLLQSLVPVAIMLLNLLLYRQRPGGGELLALLLSLGGVLLILGRGDPLRVLAGGWNPGDLLILLAVSLWALYTVLLRWRPPGLEPMAFLGFTILVGAVAILPLWLWELAQGTAMPRDGVALSVLAYVAVFPSVLSYLFWNRGVALVGPNMAGYFSHLIPVFGSLMAVFFLGEVFGWYHAVGALLVAGALAINVRLQQRAQRGI